ncbi:MAG: hypothetical protein JWO95_1594, partial [Verrucomicrobiales bacterium]|nr:hypothetical protein [Verrucomicrobiales bacterium]
PNHKRTIPLTPTRAFENRGLFFLYLRDHVLDDVARNVGQPKISTSMTKCELGVVEPQQVQNSRVEVVCMNGIFRDAITVFIGLAINVTAFDTATREPR